MPQLLQSKNLATRFQILVEIAANQPNIQQKVIASKIGVTPQAVSDYVAQLLADGFIASEGRSRYSITQHGVNWVLTMTRELKEYSTFVEKAITNISVCTAVAEKDIEIGQRVGLKMQDGLLWAIATPGEGATGIAVTRARAGSDVGVSNIEGIVDLKVGTVTLARVPGIARGGSGAIDPDILKQQIRGKGIVAAIGLEALSALRSIGTEPDCFYGVEAAIVEASYSGLSPFVLCVDDQIPALVRRLDDAGLQYSIVDPVPKPE